MNMLNKYFSSYKGDPEKFTELYDKCKRYYINFFNLFHPYDTYDVLFPYFPYHYGETIMGCAEAILETTRGIRLYAYDFGDDGVTSESLNKHGFKLQLAARIFHQITEREPTSMAVAYPATGWVTYYSYNPDEKVEEMVGNSNALIRRYGSHCAVCKVIGCKPLIDRDNKYGWGATKC